MPHCPDCGEKFSTNQSFCRSCGNDLSDFGSSVVETRTESNTVEVTSTLYHPDRDFGSTTVFNLELEESEMVWWKDGDDRHRVEYSEIAKMEDFSGINELSGISLILSDDTQIRVGCSKYHTETTTLPDTVKEEIEAKASPSKTETDSEYVLIHLGDLRVPDELEEFTSTGTLRVEGWKSGSSGVNADVNANSQSHGKSKGIEFGMMSRSKTKTKSSIEGDVTGEISDNTYTTDVDAFLIFEENLVLESEIKLNLHYSEIDHIFEQSGGVVIEVGSTIFRIEDLPRNRPISEAVNFVKEQMAKFAEEDATNDDGKDSIESADKIRELKDLHEDGILTDDEFQSKKKELLDDF